MGHLINVFTPVHRQLYYIFQCLLRNTDENINYYSLIGCMCGQIITTLLICMLAVTKPTYVIIERFHMTSHFSREI